MATEKNLKNIFWLYSQLDILTQKNVINSETAQNIRAYYGDLPDNRKAAATVVFTSLGCTLMGLGILSIIAFNWSNIPRLIKVSLSLLPLIIGLTLGLSVYKKKNNNAAWREGVGAFWFLSIGATLALISQTYNIHGELPGFLFLWILLGLPVMYVLNSSFSYFFYMAWIVWWASAAQLDGGYASGFWPLIAAAMPFFIFKFREDRYSSGVIRNSLLTAIAFTVGIGVSLEKCLPGLWIVIYMAVFSVMYLLSGKLYAEREAVLRRPFQWYSVIGIAVMSLILTLEWPWDEIGWHYYRSEGKFNALAGYADYVLIILSLGITLYLLFDAIRNKKFWLLDFGIAPIVASICFLLMTMLGVSNEDSALVSVLVILNVYCAYLGIKTILAGIDVREMPVVNGGMLMLGILVMLRFFDLDFGLLERGVAFIVVGAATLGVNILINRKIGKKNA